MKNLLFILCLLPLSVQAIERAQLDTMLAVAATAQSNAYIEARAAIVNLGTNALPMLAQAGTDATLSWQQRLVARICYERIERADAIAALRRHDWLAYPPYKPKEHGRLVIKPLPDGTHVTEVQPPGASLMPVTGRSPLMGDYVVPECQKAGLWYYFIELTWKQTEEGPLKSPDVRFAETWPVWCRLALAGQPEESYLSLAKAERLKNDPTLENRENVQFYREILKSKDSVVLPLLIDRYEAFYRREVNGPEVFPGSHAITYRGMFEPILSFADARHVELLEKFIDDHATLADLKPRLADVRARPAQPTKADPPFRLGIMPVKVP